MIMPLDNTRRLLDANLTEIERETYRCDSCGFHNTIRGTAPDSCLECENSITNEGHITETPAAICP